MKNAFLVGERLFLRPLDELDIDGNYINWLNDSEVCAFNSHHVFPYTKELAIKYINESRQFFNSLILAIVSKDQKKHIGNVSLQKIDFINRSAEFAIILGDKEFWGKGFSKEASFLIVSHGFKSLNLNRIYCGTSEKNIAMQKLAIYLGMKEEGLMRQAFFKNGKFIDCINFGILKKEFFENFF